VPLGVEHGTIGVLAESGAMFEVTTFRRDIETDGRHAVIEFASTIDEDLARRDFTINAMAWRPATDEFVDPWNGRSDLDRRVLRAVGDPAQRIAEDYLRVLRGLRFAGRLDLAIDPETWSALEGGVAGIETLSAERVREELEKVLLGPRPSASLRLYADLGVMPIWYAEIVEAPRDPRWELNLAAVDAIVPSRAQLRLTRWLLSGLFSREPEGEDRDRDEVDAGHLRAELGRKMLHRLRFSNADVKGVSHLLLHYGPLVSPVDSAAQIRRWLSDVGVASARDLFRLHFADARAAHATEKERYLVHAWRRVHEEILARPALGVEQLELGGEELLEMGVEQGPAIGILLDELHARVLENPELNDPDQLKKLATELIELGSLRRGGPE
jgi:tRNA nucleotidyltransferase (CCA-adding enzyme)